MIDLHTHLLPDLDDGSRSLQESIETLRMLSNQGYKTVICTPHVSPLYPNTEHSIIKKLDVLKEAASAASLNMNIYSGAEYSFETLYEKLVQNQPLIYVNANNGPKRYILVEFPFMMKPLWLDAMLDRLNKENIGIIIAHPERCGRIDIFKEIAQQCDCCFAINCSSVLGGEGTRVKNIAFTIISQFCTRIMFTSDSHPALHRYPQFDKLLSCLQHLYSQVIINYWFITLPRIIVHDMKISESEANIIHFYADTVKKRNWTKF